MSSVALISISFLIGIGFTVGAEVIGFVTWLTMTKKVKVMTGPARPETLQEDDEEEGDRR